MAKCDALLLPLPLLLLLAGIGMSQQASTGGARSESFYTAGVVEFRPSMLQDVDENVADNLAGYLEIIGSSNASAAEIIIFPEATLNGLETLSYVPVPEQQVVPCLADRSASYFAPFLVQLSCAARNVSKYVVINISEKQLCSDTPEDTRPCAPRGYNIFNTNVVFNRIGAVVSRYRKVHLYGEPRNTTFEPESVTFETDFDVTFGHFICFDIMFYRPAHEQILLQGIRDFILPTMWFSQLPFLTAVQVQLGWAYANDVNLLAAGASFPSWGSSGTGIYHGRNGTIESVMARDEGERRIYVAQVPRYQRTEPTTRRHRRAAREVPQSRAGFRMKRDYLENYESEWLDFPEQQTEGNMTHELCHGKFCCRFQLHWRRNQAAGDSSYGYRLGAYDGWRNEQEVDANYVRNCGIFACTGPSIEECGLLPADPLAESQVSLSRLVIEVTYPKSREFLLWPNSVQGNLLPLEPAQFEWSTVTPEKSHQLNARFALAESVESAKLLTFAIYGNYYDDVCTYGAGTPEQDKACGFQPTGDGAAELRSFGLLLWFLALVLALNSASSF